MCGSNLIVSSVPYGFLPLYCQIFKCGVRRLHDCMEDNIGRTELHIADEKAFSNGVLSTRFIPNTDLAHVIQRGETHVIIFFYMLLRKHHSGHGPHTSPIVRPTRIDLPELSARLPEREVRPQISYR